MPAAGLPGEATPCRALNSAACRKGHCYGWVCFDAAGEPVSGPFFASEMPAGSRLCDAPTLKTRRETGSKTQLLPWSGY